MAKKRSCQYRFNGCCYRSSANYYAQKCRNQCKNSNVFKLFFQKDENGCLYLIIRFPIKYSDFKKNKYGDFLFIYKYTQKYSGLILQISLVGLESYIHFLFNSFHENIYVKNGILKIIVKNINEITNNKTPYKQLKKNIKIKRKYKSEHGYINLTLTLNKELVFSSVISLYKKKQISIKKPIQQERKTIAKDTIITSNFEEQKECCKSNKKSIENNITSSYVKAVVLLHNRKCITEEHQIFDVMAIIRVVEKNGKITDVPILAAYCAECNQYIILKEDFKHIKQKGTLLCKVIDKTPEYVAKHKNSSFSGMESKVHSLGYNVIKQYGYTFEQRKIILANIIENYNITQHEILSMFDVNIARKINLPNYSVAVEKWRQDREFVENYKLGDCPDVKIDEVIVGHRS